MQPRAPIGEMRELNQALDCISNLNSVESGIKAYSEFIRQRSLQNYLDADETTTWLENFLLQHPELVTTKTPFNELEFPAKLAEIGNI